MIAMLLTPLTQRHADFLQSLNGLKHCNIEPPLEKDAIYITELQRFLSAKFVFSRDLFVECFAEVFDLDDNQVNILLAQYEIGEVIGAMAYKIYCLECEEI